MLVRIEEATYTQKTNIFVRVIKNNKNIGLMPEITLYLGITKKNTFEEIIYVAAALGITTVVPLICQKNSSKWLTNKALNRLEEIALSGCEQAKQFMPPVITTPSPILQAINDIPKTTILFNANEEPINTKTIINENRDRHYGVFIGPESGFSQTEIKHLKDKHVSCYSLTQTILRSKDAVTVGLGLLRCLLR